jgi:hypothetical protein
VVFGTAIGLVTVTTSTAGMDLATESDRGDAAGILTTARQVGGTLGLAVMGAVFVASEAPTPADGSGVAAGLEAALLVATGVCLVTAAVAFVLMRGWRGRDREP